MKYCCSWLRFILSFSCVGLLQGCGSAVWMPPAVQPCGNELIRGAATIKQVEFLQTQREAPAANALSRLAWAPAVSAAAVFQPCRCRSARPASAKIHCGVSLRQGI